MKDSGPGYEDHASIKIDDGRSVLHLKDDQTYGGSYVFAVRSWNTVPFSWYNTATFVLKGASCSIETDPNDLPSAGIFIGINSSDGLGNDYHAYYTVYPDRVVLFPTEIASYNFNTTSGYNQYTITLHEGVATLSINGQLALSHPANPGLWWRGLTVEFGAGDSNQTGEAYFDYVSANQTPIPEPSTILLLTTGLSGMVAYGFRRKRKA